MSVWVVMIADHVKVENENNDFDLRNMDTQAFSTAEIAY